MQNGATEASAEFHRDRPVGGDGEATRVSWRGPEPLGRMAKICTPYGLVPRGLQVDRKTAERVTGSCSDSRAAHPGGNVPPHWAVSDAGSLKRVSWRRCAPSASMEKSWQFPYGLIPTGSADAEKKARRRSTPRNGLTRSKQEGG